MVTWTAYVLLGILFTIISHETTGVSISHNRNNPVCRTLIDKVCYPRHFERFKSATTCRLTVCPKPNLSFYVWTDGCPICVSKRGGFGYRNPCLSQKDCGEGSRCRKNLCTYSKVDAFRLGQTCVFNNDCPVGQYCNEKGACVKGATVDHVPNVSCVFRYDCPAGFYCKNMVCYKNNGRMPDHVPGVECTFDSNCPRGSYCQDMSCIKDDTKPKHFPGIECALKEECPPDHICRRMTCYEKNR